jgi:RNA recognition motif-containing protein
VGSLTDLHLRQALANRQVLYKHVKLVKDKALAFIDFDSHEHAVAFLQQHQPFFIGHVKLDLELARKHNAEDWRCGCCGAHNFAKRTACYACKLNKDQSALDIPRHQKKETHLNPVQINSSAELHGTTLQVSGLSDGTDQETVRYSLSPFGIVQDVRIIFEKDKSTGIALVSFNTSFDASAALDAIKKCENNGNPLMIDQRRVSVNFHFPAVSISGNVNLTSWSQPMEQLYSLIPNVPEGFVYHPTYGCYFNAATHYYYYPQNKLFYNYVSCIYYKFDPLTQQYVQVNADGSSLEINTNPKMSEESNSIKPAHTELLKNSIWFIFLAVC